MKLSPGSKAPEFVLPDMNPATRAPAPAAPQGRPMVALSKSLDGRKGCVVLWMCNHCPYVVGSHERITSLARETMPLGLGWLAICSNDPTTHPEDAPEKMEQYALNWRLPFPYLWDESQDVARSFGVERTPEIFLLNPAGLCVYEGALDDNPKDPSLVKDRPLKDAIDDLLAGRPVRRPQTPAIGCTIKWRQQP